MLVRYSVKDMKWPVDPGEAGLLISTYNGRKMFAELGYKFDSKDLEDYEAQAFIVISNAFAEEYNAKLKFKGKKM